MAFPPAFLDRLRDALPLHELIGKRIALRRQGREFVACCPFHQEKSPSFRVYDNHYHCYGCGAHGDAIEFLKRHDRLDYREAVESLARMAGVPLPEQTPEARAREDAARSLYGVMEEACRWFERMLASERGMYARMYLQKRGISEESAKRFRLGLAPDGRDELKRALAAKGISEAQAIEAGLLIRPDQGAPYDRFRARLIFPICNASGKVIAFGGRLLPGAAEGRGLPKYLNSPETPLFKKGVNLYNLHQAAKPAREQNEAVLVEGYMDALSVSQAGFTPVVAPLGTAITAEQLKRLWSLADTPILCLDGDAAGMRASLRAAHVALPLLAPGKSLSFALLPKGEDPDTLIAKAGLRGFRDVLAKATALHEILWQGANAMHPDPSPASRAALEKEVTRLSDSIHDASVRAHFRQFFRERMWELTRPRRGASASVKAASPPRPALIPPPQQEAWRACARHVLKILLLQPQALAETGVEEMLAQLECGDPGLGELRDALLDACHHPEEQSTKPALSPAAEALLRDATLLIPKDALASPARARAWIENQIEGQELLRLEAEHAALTEACAARPDEAILARFMALQQELKAKKEQRLRAYNIYGEG